MKKKKLNKLNEEFGRGSSLCLKNGDEESG